MAPIETISVTPSGVLRRLLRTCFFLSLYFSKCDGFIAGQKRVPEKKIVQSYNICRKRSSFISVAQNQSAPVDKRHNNKLNRTWKKGNSNKQTSKQKSKHNLIQKFKKAKQLERQGDYRGSLALLRECITMNEHDAHSYLAMGRITLKLDGIEPARKVFRSGCDKCRSNVHLLQAWALMEMRAKNTIKATELFERALEIDDSNPYVCHSYGLMCLELGNEDKARSLWRIPLNHHR